MTRSQLIAVMTNQDLIHHGYSPPEPGTYDYEARLERFRRRVAIARRDAEQTLLMIEAAEGGEG